MIPSPSLKAFLEKASEKYHNDLTSDAIEYLEERGLTEETIQRFRLGSVSEPLPGHDKYRDRISIPYLTSHGVTSIRFRLLHGDGPKYLGPDGDPPRIYNPGALELGTSGICIAEGEFDCMIAAQVGLPCIGLPGATAWNKVMALLLEGYPQVVLLQDDDDAGEKMASKLAKFLKNLRPVVMTGGDVNSFYLEHGAEALRRKVIG